MSKNIFIDQPSMWQFATLMVPKVVESEEAEVVVESLLRAV